MNIEELVKNLIGSFEGIARDINCFAKRKEVMENYMCAGGIGMIQTILRDIGIDSGYEISKTENGYFIIKWISINGVRKQIETEKES